MTQLRFRCTACGKCCYGEVPLTLDDALVNAGRFPLAMVWTPVHPKMRVYNLTAQLGTIVHLSKGKTIAVLITPTAYIPPGMPCPALAPDNLCSIHETKPLRCKTMPFYPYREEDAQIDMLVPRKDWLCDITETAPIVYEDNKIVDRDDFDRERAELIKHAPAFSHYAQKLLKEHVQLMHFLMKASLNPASGRLTTRFSSFLLMNKAYDIVAFAKQQHPVLLEFKRKTASTPAFSDYHKYYKDAAEDLAWFAQRP